MTPAPRASRPAPHTVSNSGALKAVADAAMPSPLRLANATTCWLDGVKAPPPGAATGPARQASPLKMVVGWAAATAGASRRSPALRARERAVMALQRRRRANVASGAELGAAEVAPQRGEGDRAAQQRHPEEDHAVGEPRGRRRRRGRAVDDQRADQPAVDAADA